MLSLNWDTSESITVVLPSTYKLPFISVSPDIHKFPNVGDEFVVTAWFTNVSNVLTIPPILALLFLLFKIGLGIR